MNPGCAFFDGLSARAWEVLEKRQSGDSSRPNHGMEKGGRSPGSDLYLDQSDVPLDSFDYVVHFSIPDLFSDAQSEAGDGVEWHVGWKR